MDRPVDMNENHKNSLCVLTTISGSIKAFYQGQIEALNKAGFETTVVCADDSQIRSFIPEDTGFVPVEFSRVLSPLRDLKVLWRLDNVSVKELIWN